MFDLRLTAEPLYYDEYRQPCYPIRQEKGLSEFQNNHLLAGALADGYTRTVAEVLSDGLKQKISRIRPGETLDMLEIGGGQGKFYERVKESAKTYINVEPGEVVLSADELQRLASPNYRRIKCSAEEIPLPDESVDMIISIASLDHIPDYRKALAEIKRLLRKNGLFMMTLNNRRSWWKTALSRTEYLKRREAEIAREHYFQWSYAECKSHLSEFIPVIEMRTITYIPFIPKLWRVLLPLSDLLGPAILPKLGANIIAICQTPG
jgi:ubiquinone/menaquinone biosynthesis C-methylase UbiE